MSINQFISRDEYQLHFTCLSKYQQKRVKTRIFTVVPDLADHIFLCSGTQQVCTKIPAVICLQQQYAPSVRTTDSLACASADTRVTGAGSLCSRCAILQMLPFIQSIKYNKTQIFPDKNYKFYIVIILILQPTACADMFIFS
jgi:hypothetical protein